MPFLIDGHNLIPKLGLRLDDPDDEIKLVRLLQDFVRVARHPVEVYFDGAPTGHAGTRAIGMVKAHFVRQGQTADAAIRKRLEAMGKSAKNWTVVSSDRQVQDIAKAHQTQTIRAEEFAAQIREVLQAGKNRTGGQPEITDQEVDEWMRLFKERE